jgi:SPP1 gp7 family putative phage head morphogenesis protein
MQIARSVLVPDLLGLGGTETGGGSYALGKEQFKVFLSSIKKDRESLERKITMKLVRPLVLANFGDVPCWFEFKPYTFDDIKEYLNLWIQAVSGKIFKANEEEINYFRQVTGFPEGAVEIPKPAPAPMFGNPNGGMNNEESDEVQDKETEQDESEEDEQKAKAEKDDLPKEEKQFAFRPLTKYEKKLDFKQIEQTLDKQDNKMSRLVNSITRKIYKDLISQVREKGLLKKLKPQAIENLKPKYQKEFKNILKTYYSDFYKESYNEAQKAIFPNEKKKFAIDLVPEEFLELLDVEAFKAVGDYSFQVTKQAKNIVIQGIKDGYGAGEIVSILNDELGTTSEQWADTVVRTKTTEIYNEARKNYWEQDQYAKEIVEAYQWSAILDDRTSEICRNLDGDKIISIEDSKWLKPPAHFNCRSQLVPITKFEDYKLSPKSEINQDKLVKMGGGLLKPGGMRRRKFELEDKPTLKNASMINLFGETVVIASPGKGKRLNILSILASNISLDKPVIVGFKGQNEAELKYKTLLNYGGGKIQKEFTESPWMLDEDNGLVIDMSAPIDIEYTLEYVITNMQGIRVM